MKLSKVAYYYAALMVPSLLLACWSTRFYDCDEPDPTETIEVISEEWPDAIETMDRMDWICEPRAELDYDYDCYTDWFGGDFIHARGRAHSDLEADVMPCLVHEARHWALLDSTGEIVGDGDVRFDQEEVTRVIELAAERAR